MSVFAEMESFNLSIDLLPSTHLVDRYVVAKLFITSMVFGQITARKTFCTALTHTTASFIPAKTQLKRRVTQIRAAASIAANTTSRPR